MPCLPCRRWPATAGATTGGGASRRRRPGCSSGWPIPSTGRRGGVARSASGPDGAGYERMSCPTMLVAGWADGYRNNTFRVVEQYERNGLPWRLLAGPWGHRSPHHARPGPTIDDAREILAFFDEHLRDGPPSAPQQGTGLRAPRRLRPQPDLDEHPGVWRDVDDVAGPPACVCRPGRVDAGGFDRLEVRGDVGIAAWNSCTGALPWGQPLDQRGDNARSLVHDWPIDARRRSGRQRRRAAAGAQRPAPTATSAPSCATCSPTARRH